MATLHSINCCQSLPHLLFVDTSDKNLEVFFIDYGNVERASLSDLRHLSEELLAIPPQAFLCSLDAVSLAVALF